MAAAMRVACSLLPLLLLSFASGFNESAGARGSDVSGAGKLANQNALTRIAFGSCRNQSAPQPIWDSIVSLDPQIFIWLGDNIYADVKKPLRVFGPEANVGLFAKAPHFLSVTPEEMKEKYAEGRGHPGYHALRSRAKVIGTWDDHDYGLDDAGKELPMKRESMQLMLDFLEEPQESPRRRQDGVYTSYTYGPPGRRVKVLLLDTRFNRDPHLSDGTMLGSQQWKWFENELRNSDAQIHIIGSSIQVVSNLSALVQPMFHVEGWSRFPSEQRRLYDLIASTKAPGVLFISGDIHFAEINRYDCSGSGYPLYDVTSSGLTQATELASGPLLGFVQRTASLLMLAPMRVHGHNCRRRTCVYGMPNFGLLEINWEATPPTIDMQTRDVEGQIVLGHRVTLEDLFPRVLGDSIPGTPGKFQKFCTREVDLPWLARYRLAIAVFSLLGAMVLIPIGFGYFLAQLLISFLKVKRKSE